MCKARSFACAAWRLILLVAITALALSSIGTVQAASLDEIKKRGYLLVATEDDYKPFEFVQDGKPTGFDNEKIGRAHV